MHQELYPLPMAWPSSRGTLATLIDRDGWSFVDGNGRTASDHLRAFDALPVAERLDLRRGFEGQVALAKDTPKGDR